MTDLPMPLTLLREQGPLEVKAIAQQVAESLKVDVSQVSMRDIQTCLEGLAEQSLVFLATQPKKRPLPGGDEEPIRDPTTGALVYDEDYTQRVWAAIPGQVERPRPVAVHRPDPQDEIAALKAKIAELEAGQ